MSTATTANRLATLAANPDLTDFYAEGARDLTTAELVERREVIQWQLAELADGGDFHAGDYGLFLTANLEGVERELARRRTLHGKPGAPAVSGLPDRQQLRDDLDEIKRRLDLCATIEQDGAVRWRRQGADSLLCHCPFLWHDDTTPSFHVTPSQQLFHCFGCGFGGDVIEFIRLHLGGVKVAQAIDFARTLAGMERPTSAAIAAHSRRRTPVVVIR